MHDKDQICSKSNCRSVAIISNQRSKSLQYRDDTYARIRSPELDVTGLIGVPVGEKLGWPLPQVACIGNTHIGGPTATKRDPLFVGLLVP